MTSGDAKSSDWRTEIRLITFDLDNTLWDVEPILERAECAAYRWLQSNAPAITQHYPLEEIRQFRHALFNNEQAFANQISAVRVEAIFRLGLQSGYAHEQAQSIAKKAFDVFIQERCTVSFYDGVLDTLKLLARHFTLAAITNGNANIYATEAGQYFAFALHAEDVDSSKPDSKIFERAFSLAKKHNRSVRNTANILHVGDDPVRDIQGAGESGYRSAQIDPALFDDKKKPRTSEADWHLGSVNELPYLFHIIRI